jgi:hypothetical protein
MTERQFPDLTVEQCAEIADVCVAARRSELISAFIRDGTHPEDVRQLLAKQVTFDRSSNAEQLNRQALEEAAVKRFSFASLSGEAEITR